MGYFQIIHLELVYKSKCTRCESNVLYLGIGGQNRLTHFYFLMLVLKNNNRHNRIRKLNIFYIYKMGIGNTKMNSNFLKDI